MALYKKIIYNNIYIMQQKDKLKLIEQIKGNSVSSLVTLAIPVNHSCL